MTGSGYGRTLGVMVRPRDEDILEPILPKHPPTEREVLEREAAAVAEAATVTTAVRPSWDRLVLVGCAVVATLALVIVALRTNSIAKDQRIQTCQVRIYAAQQNADGFSSRQSQQRLARDLAECVGIDPPVDDASD
jgi:hypothetical protein